MNFLNNLEKKFFTYGQILYLMMNIIKYNHI